MAGPARPYNARDVLLTLNGTPNFLGVIVAATAVATNNLTTATPFNQTPLGPAGAPGATFNNANLANTLAGKMLIVQPTSDGFILPSASTAITLTNQTLPIGAGLSPGLLIGSTERVILLMLPTAGWLQWLPTSGAGAGNLFVWELT